MKPGQPMDVLRRTFAATKDIQASVRLLDLEEDSRKATPCLSPKASAADLQQLLQPSMMESNVEELLREWDNMHLGWSEARSELHVSDTDRVAMERLVDDAEMTALKRAEIS